MVLDLDSTKTKNEALVNNYAGWQDYNALELKDQKYVAVH